MSEIVAFIAAFLAAFVGSMSGGGAGIISLFALLALGIPVNQAVATNKFGDLGFYVSTIRNFNRVEKVQKKFLLPLIFLSVSGASLGAFLIAYLDIELLKKIIAVILFLVFFSTYQKKEFGQKPRKPKKIWPVAYFLSCTGTGLVGAGTGILSTLTLLSLRGFTALQSLSYTFTANALGGAASIVVLLFTDLIDFYLGSIMIVGNIIGAHLGSSIAIKQGNHFVRIIILVLVIVVAVQLLW